MRTLNVVLLAASAAALGAMDNGAAPPRSPLAPDRAQAVRAFIAQLGTEDFATREAAHRQLLAAGRAALPAIRQALTQVSDVETVCRLRTIEHALARDERVTAAWRSLASDDLALVRESLTTLWREASPDCTIWPEVVEHAAQNKQPNSSLSRWLIKRVDAQSRFVHLVGQAAAGEEVGRELQSLDNGWR